MYVRNLERVKKSIKVSQTGTSSLLYGGRDFSNHGRIKDSSSLGAVANAGPLHSTYNFSTPTHCGPGCCGTPSTPTPLMRHYVEQISFKFGVKE